MLRQYPYLVLVVVLVLALLTTQSLSLPESEAEAAIVGECSSDSQPGTCQNNNATITAAMQPLKIVLIGASAGTTGGLFLDMALEHGHSVTAMARTPAKIKSRFQQNGKLTMVQGNILVEKHQHRLVNAMRGATVVVGAFGIQKFADTFRPTTLYSQGIQNVLLAMKQAGVKRLIMITSGGVTRMPGGPFFYENILRVRQLHWVWKLFDLCVCLVFFPWSVPVFLLPIIIDSTRTCLLQPFMWRMYADMSDLELLVADAASASSSDDAILNDWTILRPPRLLHHALPGTVVAHSVQKPKPGAWVAKLARTDLARVMLRVVEENLYSKKRVFVYTQAAD